MTSFGGTFVKSNNPEPLKNGMQNSSTSKLMNVEQHLNGEIQGIQHPEDLMHGQHFRTMQNISVLQRKILC